MIFSQFLTANITSWLMSLASQLVTPAFLALNKSPNKSRVFQNCPAELIYPFQNPGHRLPLSPSARVPRIPPAPPALGPAPTHATPAPRSATAPGIPRTPWSRRPVRLTITAVPKITPTPENRKNPQKTLPLISREILLIF
jgi:hypothetical protein